VRVLVAGGGVAALETVLALRALAGSRVSVELVAPGRGFVDRPGSVAGAFGFGAAGELSLESIARRERLALHGGAIVRVDVEDRAAFTRDGLRLPYDALVLAVGAHARPAVPGSTTFTGPIDVPALEAVVERARRGELRELVFAAPAGATGACRSTSWPSWRRSRSTAAAPASRW
jgi:sulfide:quinone oxidoreductase